MLILVLSMNADVSTLNYNVLHYFWNQEKCHTLFESVIKNLWNIGEGSLGVPSSWTSSDLQR